ncbi:MAG TPA: amino acid adenylation domain-containing protein [Longimicrobium sp.]|nr:amino acid adenylation domain-containing protein [Longimicrobium sp.]
MEAALRALPGVADAAVAAPADGRGERRLVAYVVGRDGPPPPAAALREGLSRALPAHLVPSAFVPLGALPLTENGKTDRRALPAPPERPDGGEAPFVAPRTAAEAEVAALWAGVLGVEAVGAEDDVFALGAHSLAVTQMAARLRSRLGVDFPLRTLFAAPTPAALAAEVERRRAEPSSTAVVRAGTIPRAPRDGRLPLSFGQERVWFLLQLAPGNRSYDFQAAITFRGALDADALRRALSEIVARHEVFRTTFPEADGRPYQQVHPPFEVDLPLADLSEIPHAARAEAEARVLEAAFAEPFVLSKLPLVRWWLVRRAADEHVLVHREHHIVHDGWSFNVFLGELLALYAAFAEGRPSPLPGLPLQFADYAHAQRRWLEGPEAARQLAFWRERLAGSPPVLELPYDRPRPAEQRFRGAAPRFELPAELYGRLRAAARERGVTLFAVMLAAFDVLLARWSGADDVVVGTGIANRRAGETHGLMGMFVNSVVTRARLDDDPTFAALARRVHEGLVAAADHQELPFEALVDALRPRRSLSHNPVYQVMFSFHDSPAPELRLPGLEVEATPGLSNGSAKFDLNVIAIPHAEQRLGRGGADAGITLVWEYSSDLFDAATMEAMVRQYRALLEGAAAAPETPVSRLPLVAPDERAALVAAGRAARAFPVAERIHERFARRAAERPDAPAVTFEGASLTYAELDARAGRLARRLRALGVGPETRVGVALERSAELVVALLGVLKAGGGYVPVDPAYPAERIAFVLRDSGAAVLVTESGLIPRLPAFAGAVVRIGDGGDDDAEDFPDRDEATIGDEGGPGDLAYVIYTSGSTGKPKGVEVTHASVLRLFDATAAWFGFGADDVWTLFHSAAFDFSVWEIWGALLHGGRLVVVPHGVTRSPEDFHRLLVGEGVTVLNQTPSAFGPLVQADLASGTPPEALRLRRVVFGGEALDPQALRPWIERHGEERPRLVNMYGITETTVHVTYRPIGRADLERAGSPIGVPIPDLALHLLDARLEPVPPGVPGELFVGGAGVARGYLGRPGLTAERFLRDPFADRPDARLYRSGDRARRRADGEIEYLGRADQQVKVRGFRIETGEVEAALAAHPGVAAAAVVAREDAPGERRLVAYVVARPGAPAPAPPALRARLAATLPDYMVPAAYVALDALPLTGHGKLDRRALPAPEEVEGALAAAPYAAPGTADERALAGAWAEVLGVERVGLDDNFFALGGDSIRSVRVVAAARRRGLALSLPELFRHQTVRALAEAAAPAPEAEPVPAEPFALLDPAARDGLPPDVEDAYPAGQVQLALLHHAERDPESLVYLDLNGYRVHTRFDETAMREALRRVAARHPALRTSFDLEASPEPVQRVHRAVDVPLAVRDLRRASAAERDGWVDALKGRGFDPARAPLLRFHVDVLEDDRFRLVVDLHHAVIDGWSVATLVTELLRTFVALRDGAPLPADPPPAARYRDFVALERAALGSDASRAFWRGGVDGAPLAALPPREGAAAPVDAAPYLWTDLPAEVAAGLRRVAAGAGVPLKTVVLAAHLRVLATLGGETDVVTGYVTSGRPETEGGERALGLFLNTLPLRVEMARGSWLELVRRAWAAEEALLPHRRFPLAEIVREAGGRPLFEAAFNFNHFHVYEGLAAAGVRLEGDGFFGKTEIPLMVNPWMDPATGALRLRLEHHPARFGEEQARALGAMYARALAALAARPEAPWDAEGLLDADEEARLRRFSAGAEAGPTGGAVHAPIERRARLHPGRVAVVFEGTTLTYGELNARANALARHLRRRGVGPETRVGVCMERSLELVVALLAVLKAGGAYVPLDPGYPAERLAYMLEDAGVSVLLAQARLRGKLPVPAGVEVVEVDGASPEIESERDDDLGLAVDPSSLAYVIYTSGSTGRPKGAMNAHGAVANRLAWMQAEFGIASEDAVLQKTPFSFDVSVWELFWPLREGARLVMARPEGHRDPAYVREVVEREGVTTLHFVPSMLAAFLEEGGGARCGSVRRVVCSGEALPPALVERFHARFPRPVEFHNLYGPTEAAVDVSHWACAREDATGVVPIGRPVWSTRLHVLDAALRPVPVGVPGELYIGGAQVGRGYLGRPGLTAGRFVPDPFAPEGGARLYRTGDRARWRGDGALEYLGRLDDQVKVRGFRVEPGEVEAALLRVPGVRECAVVAREDAPGDARLVAYVVGRSDPEALRAGVRKHLPEPLVPSAFVPLAALPLTPSGKLDRRALPAPGPASAARHYLAPRTPAEETVAAIWAEVLGVERVGADESFFALGGHSLTATRVLMRVRRAFGVQPSMRAFFDHPTVAELAATVEEMRRAVA